jgi:predicted transcriptional regulator
MSDFEKLSPHSKVVGMTVTVPGDMKRRVDALADILHRSRSFCVVTAISRTIGQMEAEAREASAKMRETEAA